MPGGDTAFVDTNVLLAATDRSRPGHDAALRLIEGSGAARTVLGWSGQVVREYLVVATRPVKVNGLGLGATDALHNLRRFGSRIGFCEETETTSERLRGLARTHDLRGAAIHDANIVATMTTHGITTIVTQNPDDFSRYAGLTVVTPESRNAHG